jgi:hypothetical protein
MAFMYELVAAADPAGVIVYVAAMAFFLGSVALATHRDRVMAGSKRRR